MGLSMGELWQEALANLKERVGKQNFETWIKPLHFISRTKDEICLEVPNKFFRDWLTEHFIGQIEEVLTSLAHHRVKVTLGVNRQLQTAGVLEQVEKKEERERERPQRPNNLIPKYTFETQHSKLKTYNLGFMTDHSTFKTQKLLFVIYDRKFKIQN